MTLFKNNTEFFFFIADFNIERTWCQRAGDVFIKSDMCVLPSGRGFGLSRPPSCISSKEKDTLWTYREHKEAVRTQQSTTGNMFTAAGIFTHRHTNTDSTHSYLPIKTTTTTTQICVVKSHKNLWVLPQLPVSASSPPRCAVRPKVFSSCANTVRPPSSVDTVHHMESRESNQKRDLRCFPAVMQ